MTRIRLEKAQRLLKLNREMQKLEEEKLVSARGQQAELREEQDNLIDTLSGVSDMQALPTPMVLQRLRKLEDRQRALETEITARSTSLRTVATRAKFSERLTKEYELQHKRAVEEKALHEVIERVLRKSDASLP
ncbi:hypothetical protein [Hyphomicrobium sulfonivorans]|uniref:hypothetical protein n=1 Tax=Hyphomicrobium sulfonivorans TaxID=121290 RepID=UPI00156F4170|nr:hypothetical protein [Hyphomicrobium sulfonivorans]MBI1648750.1 hypothetical protein [Hyphomicrobium sulfonivorans]NSL70715.1 hypothetical protein [Hyphomicrobium sulfonivorans]